MQPPIRSLLPLAAAALLTSCSPGVTAPSFAYETSGGCGDIFVFRSDTRGSEFLVVDARVDELGVARGGEATFDLDDPPAGLEVRLDLYADPPMNPTYCNDVFTGEHPARWTAVSGRVTIALDAEEGPGGTYEAVVLLEGAAFENDEGRRAAPDADIRIVATVGWYAG